MAKAFNPYLTHWGGLSWGLIAHATDAYPEKFQIIGVEIYSRSSVMGYYVIKLCTSNWEFHGTQTSCQTFEIPADSN